ncbi:predicted protein, partial [Haematococcus lacustris]
MREGSSEQQLHAARLAAILAQSSAAHPALTQGEVLDGVLQLLASPSPAVAEHGASVVAVLANNPSTHTQLLGRGALPLLLELVAPASGASPRGLADSLACLLLLALHDARQAELMCRSGLLPRLLPRLAKRPGLSACEHGAALLACLAQYPPLQTQLVQAGGISVLLQLLAPPALTDMAAGSGRAEASEACSEAAARAAEALALMAATEGQRDLLLVRGEEVLAAALVQLDLGASAPPVLRHWALTLIQLLAQDESVLAAVWPRLALVKEVLGRVLGNQELGQCGDSRSAQ